MAYPLQEQLVTSQLKSELHANRVDQRAISELQQVIGDLKTDKTLLKANNEKLIKAWVNTTESIYIYCYDVYHIYSICAPRGTIFFFAKKQR